MESEECTTPSKKGGRIVNRAARGNVQGGYVPLDIWEYVEGGMTGSRRVNTN